MKVADALLKVDTPFGPCWHRYNEDGYGEHDDGSAYDGTGRGRAWPLLTGERGHYELSCGRDALPYLSAMARMASSGGCCRSRSGIPPRFRRGLSPGRPSGAAMPLVWAHAEYLKLAASRLLQRPFDRPDSVWQRYRGAPAGAHAADMDRAGPAARTAAGLRPYHRAGRGRGGALRVRPMAGRREIQTTSNSLGLYVVRIDTARLRAGRTLDFTFRRGADWAGTDYHVLVTLRTPARG